MVKIKEKSLRWFWVGISNILTFFMAAVPVFFFLLGITLAAFGVDNAFLEFIVIYTISAFASYIIFVIPFKILLNQIYDDVWWFDF